jgi:phosphate starvation-inducible membrane PsiE
LDIDEKIMRFSQITIHKTLVIRNMKAENKLFIKSFLISGLVYAGLMAGFDYSQEQDFKILKLLFHFLFFGSFMGLLAKYNHQKQIKKELNETESKPCDTAL